MRIRIGTMASLFGTLALLVACGDDGSGGSGGGDDGGAPEGGSSDGGSSDGGSGGAPAALNGCTRADAEDMTGMANVMLTWSNPHSECIVVDAGTVVTWTGDFAFHPLAGGETPTVDDASPITMSDQTGDSASVTFDAGGEYPYFCTVHTSAMQGVVYVE